MFAAAIKAAYPDITPIASFTGFAQPVGEYNDYHIYTRPDDFVGRYHQSDYVNNDNPAMVGEFACVNNNQPGGGGANFAALNPYPTWIGSVAEAVYLLGLEVNAETIFGASYAPTLANSNSYGIVPASAQRAKRSANMLAEWGTNMINFAADPSFTQLSTSWHTVKLLSDTRFTQTRTVTSSQTVGTSTGVYWAAGVNEDTGSSIIKFATYNTTGGYTVPFAVTFPGVAQGTKANLTFLTAPTGPFSHASPGYDPVVATTQMLTAGANGVFTFGLPNYAVATLATMPKGYKGTTGSQTKFAGFGGYGGCKGGRARTTVGNGC